MRKYIYMVLGLSMAVGVFTACNNDDDLTASIFDTTTPAVDPNKSTAPFDQWLYDNFVVPYNTEIQYKFNFPASQLSYQLTPAEYQKSQLLAYFIKYLFYDVYIKYAGENFMKQYGPRIFHFIGSAAYSPTTHTETLGYASRGVKITLINVNGMKLWTPTSGYSAADIELLNKDQFHTMHHEFSHILHQTKSYPVAYGQITPGSYDPRSWQERDSVESHRLGYITQYGSSASYEDFVETLSCTITDTDCRWMHTLIDACANGGVKDGDKEQVYELIQDLEIDGLDDPAKSWNNFTLYEEESQDEKGQWSSTGRIVPSFHLADSRQQAASSDLTVRYTKKVGTFTSFRSFLDNWVQIDNGDEPGGMNAILKKIDIANKWYTERWNIHLYDIRREVRQRQTNLNVWTRDNVTIFDYQ